MYVAVIPPHVSGTGAYMISREQPSFGIATLDGTWVDFLRGLTHGVQFPTAGEAINFAETRGWTVMNKRDDDSLLDVPTGRWL